MKRKSSTGIALVLITAALASCSQKKPVDPKQQANNKKLYMRGDTTAPYGRQTHMHYGPGLWWYAFRPYGSYYGGAYHHSGYYSGAISERANVGTSSHKSSYSRVGSSSSVSRGGFGSSSRGSTVSS
jgi:hypothetical protein